jgi:2-iminobutanoate/2-iminopropanoate deaminase
MIRSHNPASVPAPVGGYSHGLELEGAGRLIIVSGQIPETVDGVIPDGFGEQCRLVWANIGAVLEAAGLSYRSLVKVNTFLTDRSQADENGRIRREVLDGHEPALTVVVAQTLDARWLLEIEAYAVAPLAAPTRFDSSSAPPF